MLKYIMVILLSIIYYSIILIISFRVLQTGQVFKVLKIKFFFYLPKSLNGVEPLIKENVCNLLSCVFLFLM